MRALRPIVLIAREDERCRDVTGPRLMIRWNNGRKANNRVKEKRDSREGEGSESEANKINRENIYKYIRVHVYIYISLVGSRVSRTLQLRWTPTVHPVAFPLPLSLSVPPQLSNSVSRMFDARFLSTRLKQTKKNNAGKKRQLIRILFQQI